MGGSGWGVTSTAAGCGLSGGGGGAGVDSGVIGSVDGGTDGTAEVGVPLVDGAMVLDVVEVVVEVDVRVRSMARTGPGRLGTEPLTAMAKPAEMETARTNRTISTGCLTAPPCARKLSRG